MFRKIYGDTPTSGENVSNSRSPEKGPKQQSRGTGTASPRQRLNLQLVNMAQHRMLRHGSCPALIKPKRLLYQCPGCHRFRNFSDDRDRFILYGVTRLWPTPPPVPPEISSPSPRIEHRSVSPNCLEGTYSICRVFHSRKPKFNYRRLQRKNNTNTSVSFAAQVSSDTKSQRVSSTTGSFSEAKISNVQAKSVGTDVVQTGQSFKWFLSPANKPQMKTSLFSNINLNSDRGGNLMTSNSKNVIIRSQQSLAGVEVTSPRKPRFRENSSVKSRSVQLESTSGGGSNTTKEKCEPKISPTKLQMWATRLRHGAVLKTDQLRIICKNQSSVTAADSASSKRKRKKKKKRNQTQKHTNASKITKPRTNSSCSPQPDGRQKKTPDVTLTSSDPALLSERAEQGSSVGDTHSRDYSDAPFIPEDNESVAISTSKSEPHRKTEKMCGRKRGRARSVSVHHSSPNLRMPRKGIIANIEAVKISEENDEVLIIKSKLPRRLQKNKSKGFLSLTEGNSAITIKEKFLMGDESELYGVSPFIIKEENKKDSMTLLKEFKKRMKKCQGKGRIKPAQVEISAYTVGKRSDTKFQTLPKTYQQLGIAPTTGSSSSENCTQTTRSDTAVTPKESRYRKVKKKKKQREESAPIISRRNEIGERKKVADSKKTAADKNGPIEKKAEMT